MVPVLAADPLLSGSVGWAELGIVVLKVVLAFVTLGPVPAQGESVGQRVRTSIVQLTAGTRASRVSAVTKVQASPSARAT